MKQSTFTRNGDSGLIPARFLGCGVATLTFGNCWNDGQTKVYLDGVLIATADQNSMKTITFPFTGVSSKLMLTDAYVLIPNCVTVDLANNELSNDRCCGTSHAA